MPAIEPIQRAMQQYDQGSMQPRFHGDDRRGFVSFMRWAKKAEQEEPPYIPDSRTRDRWLMKFWEGEPHLAGVLSSVVQIDKNRGWTLLGGRNTVNYYQRVLRYAEGGRGWRSFIGKQSLNFHSTDAAAITETERDGFAGRLLNIYNVDSTRVALRGGEWGKLDYYPQGMGQQSWYAIETEEVNGRIIQAPSDYFRCASMQSSLEEYNDLGFCAVSRAVKLAQIMYAVINYDLEKLGAQAPQGLLILQNISEQQWEKAMEYDRTKKQGREQEWFSGVAVLSGVGMEELKAQLIALSTLPDNFKRENFIEFLMYGYALAFGYDAAEFWPKMRAGLGSGNETEIMSRKASGKGGTEFALEWQTQFNGQIPPTLAFEFDMRDDAGELVEVEVKQAKANLYQGLYESGLKEGASLIDRNEARTLLARAGVIPDSWTSEEEPATAVDDVEIDEALLAQVKPDDPQTIRQLREMVREYPNINRIIRANPQEPIILYRWPHHQERVIWQSGDEALRPSIWTGYRSVGEESTRSGAKEIRRPLHYRRAVLYEDEVENFEITDEDVDLSIEVGGDRLGSEWVDYLTAVEV